MTAQPQPGRVPVRLRLSRAKGFRLQALSLQANGLPAVKVDRATRYGNPFPCQWPHGCPKSPDYDWGRDSVGRPEMVCCVDTFAEWVRQGQAGEESALREHGGGLGAALMALDGNQARTKLVEGLPAIAGCNLACWCGDKPCHADVLLRISNEPVRAAGVPVVEVGSE